MLRITSSKKILSKIDFYIRFREEYQPWRTTAIPQDISISEVCGVETCFINGCGDIFSDDFWKYGFTRLGSIKVT